MTTSRRKFLGATTAMLGASVASRAASAQMVKAPQRKIATEEAFATPELAKAWLEIARSEPNSSLDIPTGILSIFDNPRPGSNQDRFRRQLLDVDAERIRDMDEAGVDMQLLSVTIPGVQIFEPARASELAATTNDYLAAAIARHPTRFAGLACFAPHDPVRGTQEMERAVNALGLKGFIVNSHTHDLYLDDPRFAPVLEAAV